MSQRHLRIAILGSFLLATFGALGLLVLHHGASPAVHAQAAQSGSACSNATLNGSYGVLAHGFSLTAADGTPLAAPLPRTLVNLVTADGAGNATRTGTQNNGGTVSPISSTGTYTVNADCRFAVTWTAPSGGISHVAGVLTDGGSNVYVIATDPGSVQTGAGERTGASSCSNATLNGSYGASGPGWSVSGADGSPLATPQPRTVAALVVADGAGYASFYQTQQGGTQNTLSGTYTVNADCTFTTTRTDAAGAVSHQAGILVDGGQKAFLVTTDGSLVAFISWERQ